jgi:hypothetical protein
MSRKACVEIVAGFRQSTKASGISVINRSIMQVLFIGFLSIQKYKATPHLILNKIRVLFLSFDGVC